MARIIETITHVDELKPACKTAAEMEKHCCEPTAALQCCVEGDPVWTGYTQDEILEHLGIVLDDQGRDALGRYVNIELGPRTKPCGEKRITYDLSGKNCCDEVEQLVWDDDASVEVLAPGTSGIVSVAGGKAPYTWSVRGTGFSFNGGSVRDIVTSTPWVRVFAAQASCGWAAITVDDGCTSASGGVRSTNGVWVIFVLGGETQTSACLAAGADGVITYLTQTVVHLTGIKNQYKTTHVIGRDTGWYFGTCPNSRCSAQSCLPSCLAGYVGDCEQTVIEGQDRYKCNCILTNLNFEWKCQ